MVVISASVSESVLECCPGYLTSGLGFESGSGFDSVCNSTLGFVFVSELEFCLGSCPW